MKQNIGIYIAYIVLALLIVGLFSVAGVKERSPGEHDQFTQCLDESGIKFYGAFWCPACAEQKSYFGKSATLLPYIECSTPDRNAQLKVCVDEGIESYPTWINSDGKRYAGVLNLELLSEITGCELNNESKDAVDYIEKHLLRGERVDDAFAESFKEQTGLDIYTIGREEVINYHLNVYLK